MGIGSSLSGLGKSLGGKAVSELEEAEQVTIEFDDVEFCYDPGKPIITNITLRFDEPGLYCIIGPNGVGKSTLVKCISKIHEPTSGDLRINGISVKELRHKDIAKVIGYVPVVANDVFSMSVVETILVGCQENRNLENAEAKMRAVYDAMTLMQIEDLGYKRFNELSAGQHQKVSIARGIVQRPRVLILDEPTANLDVKYQVYVTELLRALAENEEMMVIMISHDLNISAKYAHKVVMMANPGVIYKVGTPKEVITKENVEEVYGVRCRIIMDEESDSPIVVLGQSIVGASGRVE